MRVLLVSAYELGHQPLHVAGPAGALRERGHDVVALDLSLEPWDDAVLDGVDRVLIAVPMHTAARIARTLLTRIDLPTCCYGLYASTCADVADAVVAGEYDDALVRWVETGDAGAVVQLGRRRVGGVSAPARDILPPLGRYARLSIGGEERPVGYVEASHGCAHRCRHCPVPVVYDGRIRIVAEDDVTRDVDRLVEMGARHLTFGDPDFLNGVHHSMRVVRAVHARHPHLTFDCTVKVEHILRHAAVWPELADAGCLFVVSAFESTDDATLARLDKGHTVRDAARAVSLLRGHGIEIRPSFLPFTPWTTVSQLHDLVEFVADHDLVDNVDPVQYSIRLLLPPGSLLLDDPDVAAAIESYDPDRLSYVWHSPDPAVDELHSAVATAVEQGAAVGEPIATTYARVREVVGAPPRDLCCGGAARPRLTEAWFCCAEPTDVQLGAVR
jgi:radical SAM superfamily enzyme YgiQ (UPF0313 family)